MVRLFLLSMHKLCGQRTTDGRHKCATKGPIRIGNCTTPSIGLGRGRAVPDPGQGAGAQVGRARGGVAGDRGDALDSQHDRDRIRLNGRTRHRTGTRQDGAQQLSPFHRTRWFGGGSEERPSDGPLWTSRIGLPRSAPDEVFRATSRTCRQWPWSVSQLEVVPKTVVGETVGSCLDHPVPVVKRVAPNCAP